MTTGRRAISLGFAQDAAEEGLHVCYVYNDEHERRRVIAKYLESGLLAREKVLCLVDVMTPSEMLDCLEAEGVDVRGHARDLTVSEAGSAYRPSGAFRPQEMLDAVRDFYLGAVRDEGYAGARGTGEMSWFLSDDRTGADAVMDYEARLNLLLAACPYTACCRYDARRFDGALLLDVLSVHPVMIVAGQLVRNPYYLDPLVFLERRRGRRRSRET